MLRLAFLISVISAAAFVFAAIQMPPPPSSQPIEFNHRLHVSHLLDGSHSLSVASIHEQLLDEEADAVRQGLCTLCHGDFDEAAEDIPRIRHCAQCHQLFPDRDWTGREDQKPCMGCHNRVVDSPLASIPNIGTCVACHLRPIGDSLEEVKLLGFIEQEMLVSWTRVHDYLPGDIVFSHERHAELGRVRCQECHGAVEQAQRPLALIVKLRMEDCMGCHEASSADNDCLACHK